MPDPKPLTPEQHADQLRRFAQGFPFHPLSQGILDLFHEWALTHFRAAEAAARDAALEEAALRMWNFVGPTITLVEADEAILALKRKTGHEGV